MFPQKPKLILKELNFSSFHEYSAMAVHGSMFSEMRLCRLQTDGASSSLVSNLNHRFSTKYTESVEIANQPHLLVTAYYGTSIRVLIMNGALK